MYFVAKFFLLAEQDKFIGDWNLFTEGEQYEDNCCDATNGFMEQEQDVGFLLGDFEAAGAEYVDGHCYYYDGDDSCCYYEDYYSD